MWPIVVNGKAAVPSGVVLLTNWLVVKLSSTEELSIFDCRYDR